MKFFGILLAVCFCFAAAAKNDNTSWKQGEWKQGTWRRYNLNFGVKKKRHSHKPVSNLVKAKVESNAVAWTKIDLGTNLNDFNAIQNALGEPVLLSFDYGNQIFHNYLVVGETGAMVHVEIGCCKNGPLSVNVSQKATMPADQLASLKTLIASAQNEAVEKSATSGAFGDGNGSLDAVVSGTSYNLKSIQGTDRETRKGSELQAIVQLINEYTVQQEPTTKSVSALDFLND